MNQNKALVKKKNNIFNIILNKIKSFFYKNNENAELNIVEEKNITDFSNTYKISNDYQKLIKLQKELENDEISIADISDKQAEQLLELYQKQMPALL